MLLASVVMQIFSFTSRDWTGETVHVTVGVRVRVRVAVAVSEGVAGSRVCGVGEAVTLVARVGVIVGTAGGSKGLIHAKIATSVSPIRAGIPYLRNMGGSGMTVFLYGATTGGLPVYPSDGRSFLKLSAYSPPAKLTKLIVFSAKGTLHGTSMIGMIFLRRDSACVYSFLTHSDSIEYGVRTTITYWLDAMALGIMRTQSSPPCRSVMSHQTS